MRPTTRPTPSPTADNDGIPATDDINTAGDPFTSNGPCVAAQSYQAIINFDPDELNIPSSGGSATAYVVVPYRNTTQSVCSSVRISALDGASYMQSEQWFVDLGRSGSRQVQPTNVDHRTRQLAE